MPDNEITCMDDLQDLLRAPVDVDFSAYGDVRTELNGDLILFNYTNAAQFAGRWNWLERNSRGLILNWQTGEVVARPFRKFFNYGEDTPRPGAVLVEATEKLDGSLGILYRVNDQYRIATRGSFTSDQALWATERLQQHGLTNLDYSLTLLFEIIYPANRIVVDYGNFEGLALIGAIDRFTGRDLYYQELKVLADQYGFMQPQFHTFETIEDVLRLAAEIDANREGWVLRFAGDERFKVKGDAYKLAHKLLTGISFKRVLEAIAGGVYEQMIGSVPDEFLTTIKAYKAEIDETVQQVQMQVHEAWLDGSELTDRKQFALWVMKEHKDLSAYLFACYDKRSILPLIYKNAFKNVAEEA